MRGAGKHIDRCVLFKRISLFRENFNIPCKGCGITGDIYGAFGRKALGNCGYQLRRAALSRRVYYYNIRLYSLKSQLRGSSCGVIADEFRVGNSVQLCIKAGVLYRLRNNFNADYFFSLFCKGEPYGACAAI